MITSLLETDEWWFAFLKKTVVMQSKRRQDKPIKIRMTRAMKNQQTLSWRMADRIKQGRMKPATITRAIRAIKIMSLSLARWWHGMRRLEKSLQNKMGSLQKLQEYTQKPYPPVSDFSLSGDCSYTIKISSIRHSSWIGSAHSHVYTSLSRQQVVELLHCRHTSPVEYFLQHSTQCFISLLQSLSDLHVLCLKIHKYIFLAFFLKTSIYFTPLQQYLFHCNFSSCFHYFSYFCIFQDLNHHQLKQSLPKYETMKEIRQFYMFLCQSDPKDLFFFSILAQKQIKKAQKAQITISQRQVIKNNPHPSQKLFEKNLIRKNGFMRERRRVKITT